MTITARFGKVDAVIRHWLKVVVGPQNGIAQGLGASIQTLVTLFYADGGLVVSPESALIQGACIVLMGLFDQVGLQTNNGGDG